MSSKKKLGAPSKKTKALVDEIITRINNGESVAAIMRDKHTPSRETWFKWLIDDQILSDRYTQALQNRSHLKAEERHEVIETAISSLSQLPDGVNANVFGALIKEKVRAIEWDAERLAPMKYKPKPEDYDKGQAQPLNISFSVAEPAADIKVTNAKD